MLKSRSNSGLWWLVVFSILAVALAARLVASTADIDSFDNYALMVGVEKPFSEYSGSGYWFPLLVHYWISYRVFGGTLFGYLVLPLMSSLAMLLVVFWGLRRYWQPALGVCFFTLVVLVFNRHSLNLASYAMFTYANSLLVSCFLYFLFLRLSMGKLTRRTWIYIVACIIPGAFFSNMNIAVPVVTGAFSVVAFRWWQWPENRNLKNVRQSLVEMLPLVIFPLTYLTLQLYHPFTNWGVDKRPELIPLFFYSSGFPQNLWGAIEYLLNNTAMLSYGLLVPYPFGGGLVKPVWIIIGVIVAGILTILVIRLAQRRLESKVTFTLIFITVTFTAIAAGGLLGLYPFGRVRYADYLLIPSAVLIGYIASSVLQWILPKIGAVRSSKLIPVMLATIVFICGAYFNWQDYQSNSTKKTQDAEAFQEINSTNADMVLFSAFNTPMLAVRTPDVYENAHSMGWGSRYGHGSDGGVSNEIVEAVIGGNESGLMTSILVIAPSADLFTEQYPSWSDFLSMHFNHISDITAPSIWAGYFIKK